MGKSRKEQIQEDSVAGKNGGRKNTVGKEKQIKYSSW